MLFKFQVISCKWQVASLGVNSAYAEFNKYIFRNSQGVSSLTCHLSLTTYHSPLATCYLLLTTFLICPQTPKAQEWSETITIYSGSINRDLDAVVDSNGHLHLVWAHKVATDYWWILYSKSTDQGETWSEPYSVGQNTTGWLSSPKIAVDLNNKLRNTNS